MCKFLTQLMLLPAYTALVPPVWCCYGTGPLFGPNLQDFVAGNLRHIPCCISSKPLSTAQQVMQCRLYQGKQPAD